MEFLPHIDVIVLSYAKDESFWRLTQNCLNSLSQHRDDARYNLRVTVVETNDRLAQETFIPRQVKQPYYNLQCLLYPGIPFNYNLFLQQAYEQILEFPVESLAQNALLISNNDVTYQKNCLTQLLKALEKYESISPWCPEFHDNLYSSNPIQDEYIDYRTTYAVCGWSIMLRRSLMASVKFNELFPEALSFWFQDNYYADVLQVHGWRHALIRAAKAQHLAEQSHKLMPPDLREQRTGGLQHVYHTLRSKLLAAHKPPEPAKTSKVVMIPEEQQEQQETKTENKQKDIVLTIAIASITKRAKQLQVLIEGLNSQAKNFPVEILILTDNQKISVGKKRDRLINLSQGKYIAFVDDDDRIAADYLPLIFDACAQNPGVDCVTFDSLVTWTGYDGFIASKKPCSFGLKNQFQDLPDRYLRTPNHLCAIRRELALKESHEDANWGEDRWWELNLLPHLKTEYHIDKILYYYEYNEATSETQRQPKQEQKLQEPAQHTKKLSSRKCKIAVYAIAKNEEAFVDRFVQSVQDADCILVADTGSDDNTVDKLKKLGVQTHSISIHPWRFDLARNAALALVPSDVNLCIKLDLDELMDPGWREAIEDNWNPDITRLHYRFHYTPEWCYWANWIHAREGYYWRHAAHEILYSMREERSLTIQEGLSTSHLPDPNKPRSQYLPLLELDVRELPCSRGYFYLGREYFYAHRFDDTIKTLKKYLEYPETWNSERMSAQLMIAECYQYMEKPDQFEIEALRAHLESPRDREPLYELAKFNYHRGDHISGLGYAIKALSIHGNPMHVHTRPQAWNEMIYYIASILAFNVGLKEKSQHYNEEGLKINPRHPQLLENAKWFAT